MSTHHSQEGAEERALKGMAQELASERLPDLPWDKMERELMARLDEAPMTSQPRSLDARVDDVPVSSMRSPRLRFVRIGFVALAAAAVFALFWISPLHSGKPIVISTATPSVAPAAPNLSAEQGASKTPATNADSAPVCHTSAPLVEPPPRKLTANDAKSAFMKCIVLDKDYEKNPAPKLKGEKLVVFLEPDGRVATIRFDSPLEPVVMKCVFAALRPGRFVGTTRPVTIQF